MSNSKKYIIFIQIIVFVLIITSFITTWSSQPDSVEYFHENFSYQRTENVSSTIDLELRVFQNKTNEVIIETALHNQPQVSADIQVNLTYMYNPGFEIGMISLANGIKSLKVDLASNFDDVKLLIHIFNVDGYTTVPVIIESYEQKLEFDDFLTFLVKYSFPLLSIFLINIYDSRIEETIGIEDYKLRLDKPIIGLPLLTIISYYFFLNPVISSLFLLGLITLIIFRLNYFARSFNSLKNHILTPIILVSVIFNQSELSLGEGFISKKIEFLNLFFPIGPLALLLVLILEISIIFYLFNSGEKKPSNHDYLNLFLYTLMLIISVIFISRLF